MAGHAADVQARLRDALFGTALTGIEATGRVYPLGAFLLVGAMLDMLAGLMHARFVGTGEARKLLLIERKRGLACAAGSGGIGEVGSLWKGS